MKNIILAQLILTACAVLSAQEKTLNSAADFTGNVKKISFKDNVMAVKGSANLWGSKILDVTPDKVYYVSGEFRQTEGEKPVKVFLGFQPLDRKNRAITCSNVGAVKGTDTEVAEDCPKGSLQLKVKDASKWAAGGRRIFFHTDPEYKDLPNFNQIGNPIVSIDNQDGVWIVTFKTKLRVSLAKGTRVRQHLAGGSMYAAAGKPLRGEWQEFSGRASGIRKEPGHSNRIFPVGTRKVKLILFVSSGSQGSVSEIRNLTFDAE